MRGKEAVVSNAVTHPAYLTGNYPKLPADQTYPIYQWDTTHQENVSLAVLIIEEAREYLELFKKDTHGELSTSKDYTGVCSGLKGAYAVAKELGGLGATAKAVSINGVMHVVIDNYKPKYLDLGVHWQRS